MNSLNLLDNKFIQKYISKVFNQLIISTIIRDAILYINLKKKYFLIFFSILKNHTFLNFNMLMDIWAIDFPNKKDRFQLNYLLVSSLFTNSIIIRTNVFDLEPHYSITKDYSSAGWLEREVWDMFGVFFYGNPDLRRILTDYGFEGFPLRKDFPLSGFYEIRFDYEQKRLTFDSIELTQEFRFFYFQNVWK